MQYILTSATPRRLMIPGSHHLWRLSEAGDESLGLSCIESGLFLGRTPLVERHDGGFAVRPEADLERLLRRAYGTDVAFDRVRRGLAVVASALNKQNLCLAQIAAIHLRLPDLPDPIARSRLESEDLIIKRGRADDQIARGSWDEAQHPRTGTPPNPGWFAPKDRPTESHIPTRVAAGEREERKQGEELDPLAEVRQAQWDAKIDLLRRIDPNNPNLTYLADPNSAPSQEALDRLDEVVKNAVTQRILAKVNPGGVPIGRPGASLDVRELPGGFPAAKDLFDYLRVGGIVHGSEANLEVVRLPGDAGFVTFRSVSRSGSPAIDVNLPDAVFFIRFHFP